MKQFKLTFRLCFILPFFFLFLATASSQNYTISGYIEDAESGEKLISANAFEVSSTKGTVSNAYGFYSLTLPKDSVVLAFSYIGYQSVEVRMMLGKDIILNIRLEPQLSLQEIEVVADKYEDRIEESSRMSTVDVPIAQIKKIPGFLGEVDVLKALQLLPGVQSGGEGQNGLYVRGGSPDQNLILLDGVPVYNASHLFGFFSVFNVDAVKDVKLTKGGFPARYGGRLSSVIEINMKEGNINEWKGAGSIGIVASRLTVEGPIKKDKTSIILSARRTYIDILARPLIKKGFEENDSEGIAGYYFYDFNGKINHKFSDKDRLYFSVYTGKDKFYVEEKYDDTFNSGEVSTNETEFGLGWGNITSALRWNHLWTNKLFSNTTITFSRYEFDTKIRDKYGSANDFEDFRISYLSGIDDVAAKIDFDYVPDPDHFIRFGAGVINHTFKPGKFNLFFEEKGIGYSSKIDTILGQDNINAQEYSAYVEDDMKIGDNLKLNAGVHFSMFGLSEKSYASVQPRLSMRYMFPGNVALKGSFASMRQYVQLLTNEGVGLPTDLWLPTTKRVKPQDSWQAAIGLAKTFNNKYEISLEGYYKKMTNLLAYKEGASFFSLNDWQDDVTQGDGEAYGIELFVQKKTGRLSGWVGYTLAWAFREFPEINLGKRYPFKYDRRHDISVVATYDISKRINISGAWVYGTGNAVTLANSQYNGFYPTIDFPDSFNGYGFTASYYENRNNFRMRSYHRLDFGINFVKEKKRHTRTWSFGAYNIYSRKNPFFLFTDSKYNSSTGESTTVLKQASLFPIIPYFNYSFEF